MILVVYATQWYQIVILMSNWNYIAFTMDGTKLTPYCNGVAQHL